MPNRSEDHSWIFCGNRISAAYEYRGDSVKYSRMPALKDPVCQNLSEKSRWDRAARGAPLDGESCPRVFLREEFFRYSALSWPE